MCEGREMKVNPNVLLQGPWYSLEQCGFLLQAAVTLFEAKQYPTAAALALLVHEELGKYGILVDLWWQANVKGVEFNVSMVRDAYGDHVKKQRRGQLSVVLKGISVARDKLQETAFGDWLDQLYEFAKRKAKRTPDDRHRTRMRALYVDLKDLGDGWDRPAEIGRDQAHEIIEQACNDYSVQYSNLRTWLENPDSPQSEALRAWIRALPGWPERPELPVPKRPSPTAS